MPNQVRVTDAIAHWEARTRCRFVLRTPQNAAQFPDFVEFVPGQGCSSFVGKRGCRQTVPLGDGCSTGNDRATTVGNRPREQGPLLKFA